MLILRGRHAGKKAKVHQFANDWISVDLDGGGSDIVSPAHIRLDPDERPTFTQNASSVGMFWTEWRLNDDGTFTSIKPRTRRARTRKD